MSRVSFSPPAIAVVGLACRFPGAPDAAAFWQNLRHGVESIQRLSEAELDAAGVPRELRASPNHVNAFPSLEGIDQFDAGLFGYSAREAEVMDPQHRLFLECAWEALESAGRAPRDPRAAVGVFAGAHQSGYLLHLLADLQTLAALGPLQTLIATDKDFLTTRVSYKLNLRGPSVDVQSACSTSLVALHLACQSLLAGECDLALAGAVSIALPQNAGYLYQEGGILSPDGRCRPFDASARGTVFGNGVGVVALRRFEDAAADGDPIRALIRATAVNNDGAAKLGYTAPGLSGQAAVIAEALAVSGVPADSIGLVEAHGTGTPLGDPVEFQALTRAFEAQTSQRGYCALGSVKSNVGHLNTAAGIAGLIKVVLALEHGEIPPTLHFEKPNPRIDLASSPFFVNNGLRSWRSEGRPHRAAVSSFGVGGTNAHVILEQAPPLPASGPSRAGQILAVSARSESAADEIERRLAETLRRSPNLALPDVAHTLQVGRHAFAHRRALVCADLDEAVAALEGGRQEGRWRGAQPARPRSPVFLFPDSAAALSGLGVELYRTEPGFHAEIDRACEIIASVAGSETRAPFEASFRSNPASARGGETPGGRPLAIVRLVAVELALAKLWRSWGVVPTAVLGCGVGEYAAAHVAGILTLTDALRLALGYALETGPAAQRAELARVALQLPGLPYASAATGSWIAAETALDRDFWAPSRRDDARVDRALQALLADPDRALIEVGPATELGERARAAARAGDAIAVGTLLASGRSRGEEGALLASVAQLWVSGVELDWWAFVAHERRQRVPLPGYAFERRRYWIKPRRDATLPPATSATPERRPVRDWFSIPSWKRAVRVTGMARSPSPVAEERTTWVLLGEHGGLTAAVATELGRRGHPVVTVIAGDAYQRHASDRYELRVAERSDYEALVKDLRDSGSLPRRWLHLWNAEPAPEPEDGAARWSGSAERPFHSLLALAQALGSQSFATAHEITVVTQGLWDVTGEERLVPERALALGPCRVLPQEHPRIACRSVDIASEPTVAARGGNATNEDGDTKQAVALLEELLRSSSEPVVALRGRHVFVPSFEPVRVDAARGPSPRLRPGATYLITGGLGGIGLTLARRLASLPGVKLALIGRSALPPRSAWEDHLETHPPTDATSRRINALLRLEESGADVLILQADVADLAQMRAALATVRQRFGAVHGAIHAAGTAGIGLSQLKSREQAERVLAPKVEGTLILAELLAGEPLAFLALCSSTAAILGDFGQIDYAAANAYLDAFAAARRTRGGPPVVAIDWSTWAEVGMAVELALPPELEAWREDRLRRGIKPDEGADAFVRVLGLDSPRVVVSPEDLHSALERALIARRGLERAVDPRAPHAIHARPALAEAFVPPRNELEAAIAKLWTEHLGVDPIGVRDSFFDLGGHSLLAIQLVSRIRDAFSVEIPAATFLAAPTVAALCEALARAPAVDRPAPPAAPPLAPPGVPAAAADLDGPRERGRSRGPALDAARVRRASIRAARRSHV